MEPHCVHAAKRFAMTEWAEQLKRSVEKLTEIPTSDASQFVKKIPNGEAFDWLTRMTGETPQALTETLYNAHNVGFVWYIMGCIGIVSAIGIWVYGKWILTLKRTD